MQIVIADDKKFEKHNVIEKVVRVFTVPLLNSMPGSLVKKVLGGTNKGGKVVIEKGGSARSLEVMYSRYEHKIFSHGIIQEISDYFWHNFISQPRAIRNRLKIVKERLENEILNLFYNKKQNEINILTVAGGSARAVVETVYSFKDNHPKCNINVINIDKSEDALNLGKELAERFNVSKNFHWINDIAHNIPLYIKNNSIDIVEMVGLLDYFNDKKGVEVFNKVYDVLKDNGMFITANIAPNKEMSFVDKIGWPKMYYRTPERLARILNKAGFSADKGKIIIEPLKIHIVAVVRK